jgi:hypothetical protein
MAIEHCVKYEYGLSELEVLTHKVLSTTNLHRIA